MRISRKWASAAAAGVVTLTAAVLTLADGAERYDSYNLPRWAWRSELTQLAQAQQQTKLDVLILQKAAAEDQRTKVQLIKSDYELQEKPVPDYITDELQKKEQEIDDYNDQILLIKRQAE